ncbi:MAG: hypothetical protein ACREBU_17315, partial [Nitrososphaera sp.]
MAQILQLKFDFWTLSYKTQDMIFSYYFLDNIQFWHRTLAITFGFAAITTFYLAVNTGSRKKWAFLAFASLFMIMSYFIHMLPLIFVFPAITYLWYTRGRHSWRVLAVFAGFTIATVGISDALLNGYYSSLSLTKIRNEFFPSLQLSSGSMYNLDTRISGLAETLVNGYHGIVAKINNEFLPLLQPYFDSMYNLDTRASGLAETMVNGYHNIEEKIRNEFLPSLRLFLEPVYKFDIGIAISVGLVPLLFGLLSRNRNHKSRIPKFAKSIGSAVPVISSMVSSLDKILDSKILHFSSPAIFGAVLVGIYIYGIAVWTTFPPTGGLLYEINQIPWYFVPIRFGFTGLLA